MPDAVNLQHLLDLACKADAYVATSLILLHTCEVAQAGSSICMNSSYLRIGES